MGRTRTKRKTREAWGRVRELPSGRYQAAYTGPDLAVHKATSTFPTLMDARGWLTDERRTIDAGTWRPPAERRRVSQVTTFRGYAEAWLTERELKPRTRDLYRKLLDAQVLPELGAMPLTEITPAVIRSFYGTLDPAKPTRRAHAYSLVRTILNTAVSEELLAANPCRIRGAGVSKRQKKIKPATLHELETIATHQPERYKGLVLLAAWCALRFGELTELRRKDIDLDNGLLMVRRAVVVVDGQAIVGDPKSDAGVRDVAIPPHLLPAVEAHLEEFSAPGPEGLVFPGALKGEHLAHGTYHKTFSKAREAAGRPDLRFHDLRHTGAVLAAQTGATLAELMGRLGHSTPSAALRYQHAAEGRDAEIARLLSELATGGR